MQGQTLSYSLPRWRVTRWLGDAGPAVPEDIRVILIARLFGAVPVLLAGALNTLTVAIAAAISHPSPLFIGWLVAEIAICSARVLVLVTANRAAQARRKTPTDLHLLLAVLWSISVGFGAGISLASGEWPIAMLACITDAAMVGGICFRNFFAPRLAATMILCSLGPIAPAVALTGHPLLYIAYMQIPLYVVAMTIAAFRLNRMQIATLRSERDNVRMARHDALTGLLNRAGLVDALQSRLASGGHRTPCALLYLDLDNFKPVNDTFGHRAGDTLLELVAARLRHTLAATDIIARIGGDEFVVLANDVTAEEAMAIGRRIIAALGEPYGLGEGISARVGASVGIALSPQHAGEAEVLLALADTALYEAKSGGKSRCRLASTETDHEAPRQDATAAVGSAKVAAAA